jgi:hypothetical protein
LAFRLLVENGAAKIKWRYRSKNYSATVDACGGGYWTATTTNSAIVVKLAQPTATEPPPQ